MKTDTSYNAENGTKFENEHKNVALYKPISAKDWLLSFILLSIPVVNLIILIVWVLSDETHPSKRNFAKACLMLVALSIVIAGLIFYILFGTFLSVVMNS